MTDETTLEPCRNIYRKPATIYIVESDPGCKKHYMRLWNACVAAAIRDLFAMDQYIINPRTGEQERSQKYENTKNALARKYYNRERHNS